MNKLQSMRDRIVEIAEENGWEVDVESNDGDNFSYEFSQGSPAGQDLALKRKWKIIMYTHYWMILKIIMIVMIAVTRLICG